MNQSIDETLTMCFQTSATIYNPQHIATTTNESTSATSASINALLYTTNADEDEVYRVWQGEGYIE